MYSDWLFIDKADLAPEAKSLFPGARLKGTMEKLVDWSWVRFVSVCYTPVGPTILNRCPNLEWVMVRGTAHEKVVMGECRRRGIGVAEAIPTHENCSDYLVSHLRREPYLFYGYGNIGSRAAEKVVGDWPHVNRKTGFDRTLELVSQASTVVMSVSYRKGLRKPPVFGSRFFQALRRADLVSVCRPGTMNNSALLEAIKEGRVRRAVLDTVGKDFCSELIATDRVVDTHHTAWRFGMSRDKFLQSIKGCVDSLMTNSPKGVVLPRRVR